MKMIVCWPSATYFQFHSRQFTRSLAEDTANVSLLIHGDACCISTVVSDYNMPYSL